MLYTFLLILHYAFFFPFFIHDAKFTLSLYIAPTPNSYQWSSFYPLKIIFISVGHLIWALLSYNRLNLFTASLRLVHLGFFKLLFFVFNYFIVVQLQLPVFTPTTPPPPQPSPSPAPASTSNWFCPCVLHSCSWKPFPLFPPLSPPTSPLVTVRLFLISMSLVIFSLLVCFID